MFSQKKNIILIGFLIAALFCIPYCSTSVFAGLDMTFHLSRIDGMLSSIRDLQFPHFLSKIAKFDDFSYICLSTRTTMKLRSLYFLFAACLLCSMAAGQPFTAPYRRRVSLHLQARCFT